MCTDSSRAAQRKYNASEHGKEVRKAYREKKEAEKGETQENSMVNSPLVRGLPESERKDIYYHFDDASGRDIVTQEVKIINKDAIKYENIMVNENIPEISGTEKQVKYAKDLIRRKTEREIELFNDRLPSPSNKEKRKEAVDKLIEQANKAGANASNLSDVINFAIVNGKNSALSFAKTHPTARAIIDKYR